MQNGKGDSPRKKSVSQEVWNRNWEKIFRSDEKQSSKKIFPQEESKKNECGST